VIKYQDAKFNFLNTARVLPQHASIVVLLPLFLTHACSSARILCIWRGQWRFTN